MSEQSRPNLPEFTVSEISLALKRTVEEAYALVRVRGEISGFKRHGSGHLYFALKDADSVLDAVCWKGTAARLAAKPEDGLEMVCTGRLTTYAGRSKYQLVVEAMELAGQGALLKLLEERKKKLAAEGLFDGVRKKALPFLPRVIGIVTSPTGAVIRDILHRLADRFPRHVLVWGVAVQGEGAAEQIARAIDGFNALASGGPVPRPDLLIVARGGGSIEDLWAFNEEIVVRAAARSAIPLISAVGHETDTTLIDFAADVRAPTPTAAAEMAVPVRHDLLARVQEKGARLTGAIGRRIGEETRHLDALGRGLPRPERLVEEAAQKLDERSERLIQATQGFLRERGSRLAALAGGLRSPREVIALKERCLERPALTLGHATTRLLADRQARLERIAAMLEMLSHQSVLARGYALVQDDSGHVVSKAADAQAGARWQVSFHDGSVAVQVGAGTKPRKSASGSGQQGSLL
ncbi:MAG: exodeoxyribonuclease VII large subunit [Rhodospirillales bacterium]|nr:exodeoxyribonuclease VII large subunit [Rhodospirillales bacterium]